MTPPDSHNPPVFAQPWQAQAFAMTLQLHQRGLFTWPQWAAALAAQIAAKPSAAAADPADPAAPADPADSGEHHHHWLAALEALVVSRGAAQADELARCARAWHHAAHRTPHGQPIDLRPGDFGR